MEVLPPRIDPPAKPLGRLAFISTFVRNPLEAIPRAVYEEDLVPMPGGGPRGVWITSPALVKTVLLDERDKFRKLTQIRLLGPLLGKGLLTSEGADWKWQRQAAAPIFRPTELAAFVPRFVQAAEAALERWRAGGHESVQAIDEEMTHATFDVISTTLLPPQGEAFAGTVQRAVETLRRFGGWDIFYAALNLPRWVPRPGYLGKLRAMRTLRAEVLQRLHEHRARGAAGDDLMGRLMAARDPESGRAMDDEQLVDNLLTFYLAGHETTATALAWTLHLLAHSPEWTRALEEEVEAVTGGAPVGAEHLERLVLVQQVIKESMRLMPPVPVMSRQAAVDVVLEGRRIPAGASVLIPIYVIHRHSRRWERPDEFDPARFSPAREEAIPRYQYMPFGAGPRICIGMSFALAEAAAILATLLRGARFAPADASRAELLAGVTLRARDGLKLRVVNKRGQTPI
jgi:cytochrome P450